ncbi:hypothetical protein BGW80DRAFT_1454835 [Lactifluus volemus]|nr:hypothetical protein BGW80DRAFT_1454835 [Lactifluus volemus]
MAKAIDITTWRCSEKVAQSPTINYSAFRRLVGPEGLKRLKEIINGTEADTEKQNTYGISNRKVVHSCLNLLVGEEGQGSSVAQFTDTQKWGDTDNGATASATCTKRLCFGAFVLRFIGKDAASSEEEFFLMVGWNTLEDQKKSRESDEVKAMLKEMAEAGALDAHTVILQVVTYAVRFQE